MSKMRFHYRVAARRLLISKGAGHHPVVAARLRNEDLCHLGHLYQMPAGHLPLVACPAGSKPQGRPKIRWTDYDTQLAWDPPARAGGIAQGNGKSGRPCSDCCPLDLDNVKEDRWLYY